MAPAKTKSAVSSVRGASRSPKPANTEDGKQKLALEFEKKAKDEARAISWMMHPHAAVSGVSGLGGKFLRVYLDEKRRLPSELAADAAKEIGESSVWNELQEKVQKEIQKLATKNGKLPTGAASLDAAKSYLQRRLKEKGIAFKGDTGLNVVVGGITGIDVVGVSLSHQIASEVETVQYTFIVRVSDTYDFSDNKRYGSFESLRKHLGSLIRKKQYDAFWSDYRNSVKNALLLRAKKTANKLPFVNVEIPKDDLDEAAVFAAYMYALESNRVTNGQFSWSANIEMKCIAKIHL